MYLIRLRRPQSWAWALTVVALVGVPGIDPTDAVGSRKEPEPVRTTTNGGWVSESNREFALDLYSELAGTPGNFFFSPYSISSALAMTMAGARGETATQMEGVLHLERDDVHQAFADLREVLAGRSQNGPELSIANRLWGQRGLPWEKTFLEICKKRYAAALAEVDFRTDPEGARKRINDWCAEETRDKIQNLLAPGLVDTNTRLVLTNAIYFKGSWKHTFKEKLTQDGPFFLSGGSEVQVPLMRRTGTYGYYDSVEFQALEMPYVGDELSMVVLLPKTKDGIGMLESALDTETLDSAIAGLREREVQVAFPRFELTSKFSLASVLSRMGMETAFSSRADFSGMCEEPLFIGAVEHKAFVQVNEEGTEAAAATAVTMQLLASAQAEPPKFVADHPFVFLIRDKGTGSVLFLGRMADPRG